MFVRVFQGSTDAVIFERTVVRVVGMAHDERRNTLCGQAAEYGAVCIVVAREDAWETN